MSGPRVDWPLTPPRPHDASQGTSYRGALFMDVCYQIEGGAVQRFSRRFGLLPIMVKSEVCYLRDLDRSARCPAAVSGALSVCSIIVMRVVAGHQEAFARS